MKPAKDKKYLQWIRCHPCVVTGNPTNVVAHHVTVGALRGIGQKPTDYWAIPIDATEHRKLHDMGELRYWQAWSMDPHHLILSFLSNWSGAQGYFDQMMEHMTHFEYSSNVDWAREYDRFIVMR